MSVTLSTAAPQGIAADLLVIPIFGALAESPRLAELEPSLRAAALAEAKRRRFTAARGQELWLHAQTPVLFLGGGARPAVPSWYDVAEAVVRQAARLHTPRVTVALGALGDAAVVGLLAEGVALARYSFSKYRSRAPKAEALAVTLAVAGEDAAQRAALAVAAARAGGTILARDLANTPADDLAPMDLARVARGLAGKGLRVRVYDRAALRRLRMGAILGVGQGSEQPPCFIELAYTPRRARRRVALVGKGITFDSGGLSLKNADSMQAQKRDMAGAAVVLGAMSALPALGLPIEVRGYIGSAENMPSGSAMRPGDVLRAYNGTTIEVLNTDAEGRLVLADALSFAARQQPDCIIDFATLTAAVRTTLGPRCAAIMGSERRLVGELIASAADVNEMLWEFPLIEEYRRDIDSRVADLKNVGEGHSGTIVAALFLREFVGGLPWAHIDFSSTVMSEGFACHPRGASGYGVRTVLRWLERFAAQPLERTKPR
jgi:leucyl aminopeptidase